MHLVRFFFMNFTMMYGCTNINCVLVTLLPPQIPQGPPWDRTRCQTAWVRI